jgi:hypothetical protein
MTTQRRLDAARKLKRADTLPDHLNDPRNQKEVGSFIENRI